MKSGIIVVVFLPLCLSSVTAMVGGATPSGDGVGRAVVTIVGSHGTFCSGALIAPDLVLSAAHCIAPDTTYKLVIYDPQRPPRLLDIKRVATHPLFNLSGISAHRASADVALLQLSDSLSKSRTALPVGVPNPPLAPGIHFLVAGIGVSQRGDGKSGGTVRAADLVATDHPGDLQLRLVDPATNNAREGLGACTGDSGAPVLQDQEGHAVIIGVVSWSTGAHNSAGCGGLTGVTPLMRYRNWIVETAEKFGSPLRQIP